MRRMEINNLFGLPAHPLLVHAPIVLVPLCFVAAVLMAIRPEWRRRFGVPTAVVALGSAVAVQLAMGSGEQLEERVRESNLIEQHAGFAELARPFVFLFALALTAVVVWDVVQSRRASTAGGEQAPDPRMARFASIAMVVTVLLGGVATYEIVQTGHSGAKATWHDTPAPREGSGESGESGGDRD